MRIIAGEFKGRKLKSVPGQNTRPTTDKIKESIFNIIGPYFEGGDCLDLYSGSGALGIEAVSRGAEKAYLIDRSRQAIQTIQTNVALTKNEDKFEIIKTTSALALEKLSQSKIKFKIIFLDPPYAKQRILQDIQDLQKLDLLEKNAIIVCEVDKHTSLDKNINQVSLLKKVNYGNTTCYFYEYMLEGEGNY
ncbi:16S rRNA (guanine(966)-N(2))-methyltransferase RsmD [Lacticigenium naphthae]|uniref:16S rRNA (guanine(966)-N(2))-methyltransferase RsmD n=1 Tax=Lacticigenium naphthae TaxID=515351 RepID=UPI00040DC868|nr:16S rRNA (guanine(966)-N(2))-methyltransferase RsmD [Lacticigenium naphthae]